MPTNISTEENNNQVIPAYKDPFSAKVVAALAIFLLIAGIGALLLGIKTVSDLNDSLQNNSVYSIVGQNTFHIIWPFALFAISCFIISSFLYVIYNITCDTHRTAYNMERLLENNQNHQNQLSQELQYIDDSIIRQSSTIIRQLGNNKNKSYDNNTPLKDRNAHDGAF